MEPKGGKMMFVPDRYFKTNRKHQETCEWVNLWFYKQKVRIPVKQEQVKYDYEITSKLSYQKDTFYKLTTMSASDPVFEYFYKIRSDTDSNIFKKNKRYKKLRATKLRKDQWKNQPRSYTVNSNNKFIVNFE
jgi:hypothetical protein